jgi:hypothetical protein
LGVCYAGLCQSIDLTTNSDNCGLFGLVCPSGSACAFAQCGGSQCDSGGCPAGTSCYNGTTCLLTTCGPGSDDQTCLLGGGAYGSCCKGACVPFLGADLDPQNCGGCGIACSAGQVCVYGRCEDALTCGPTDNGRSCQLDAGTGGICCLGSCVDPNGNDPDNCGGCNVRCPQGLGCQGGICMGSSSFTCGNEAPCPEGYTCNLDRFTPLCGPTSCAAGSDGTSCLAAGGLGQLECCDGACIDTSSDAANCGACGLACEAGDTCVSGSCLFQACPVTLNGCQSDAGAVVPPNCGSGNSCPAGTTCFAGNCLPTDPTACAMLGDGSYCYFSDSVEGVCCAGQCANTSADPSNCNECGNVCPAGQLCLVLAAGGCFNPQPDATCEQSCGPNSVCSRGTCISAEACNAPGGSELCEAEDGTVGLCCAGNVCAHPADDPQNCGGCGLVCPQGQSCRLGACG